MTILRRAVLFLAACLCATAAHAQPTDEEVREALRDLYGPGVETYGHIIDHGLGFALNTGFGTTRVAGLLNVTETHYENDQNALRRALAEIGIGDSEATFHARRMRMDNSTLGFFYPAFPMFKQIEEPRSFVPFVVDFSYAKNANGSYWLSRRSAEPTISGRTLAELPANTVLVGSPEFGEWLDRFATASVDQRAYQERTKAVVEDFLAGRLLYVSGPKDAYAEPVRLIDRYTLTFPSPFAWELEQEDRLVVEGTALVSILKDDVRFNTADRKAGETFEAYVRLSVHLEGAAPTIYLRLGSNPSTTKIANLSLEGTPFSYTAQPPLRGIELATPWSNFRVSRETRVRFVAALDECVEFRSDRVRSGESLVYFPGPNAQAQFKGTAFIVTGPIESGALTYTDDRRILVQARRYPKDNGSCRQ